MMAMQEFVVPKSMPKTFAIKDPVLDDQANVFSTGSATGSLFFYRLRFQQVNKISMRRAPGKNVPVAPACRIGFHCGAALVAQQEPSRLVRSGASEGWPSAVLKRACSVLRLCLESGNRF